MRANVPEYKLVAPRSLSNALEMLAAEPGAWRAVAGCTDVMVLFEAGKLTHRRWISIRGLPELRGIAVTPEHVTLGALTSYTEVRRSAVLADEFPMLVEAAALTGGIATQNRGTLGGNIVNASPAADTPPALLVYDARIELVSARGSRWLPYAQFHLGYKRMDLEPDELLSRIRLPRQFQEWRQVYRKVGTRRAQAISKVCFAAAASGGHIRIGLGSVAPVPLLVVSTSGSVREDLEKAVTPIDDVRSTARYRALVARNLLEEFLRPT